MTAIATECRVCPKGIVACAHMDGRVVWLVDSKNAGDNICFWHWQVWGPIPLPQGAFTHYVGGLHTDFLPEAKAEFECRCALLRAEA